MLTMKVVLATVVPAALLPTAATTSSGAQRPNLLLVMCDDLDTLLGSEIALPQTRRLLASGGARAMNYFVSSPKCTPSRSAWLSGRHYHNLRPNGTKTGPGLNTSNFFDQDAVFPTRGSRMDPVESVHEHPSIGPCQTAAPVDCAANASSSSSSSSGRTKGCV